MRYRLQRHDGTDCSATMVPITVLRMVPIQRYRHSVHQQQYSPSSTPSRRPRHTARLCQKRRSPQHPINSPRARCISSETLLPLPKYKTKRSRPTASRHLSVHSVISLSPALSAIAETHSQKEKPYITGLI